MNEPNSNKDKKIFNKNWTWVIALFVFFMARGISQHYSDRKVYQTVRNAIPNITTKFNNLPQDEQNRFYELRDKAFQVIRNHLDEPDKTEYTNLVNGGFKTDEDIDRGDVLLKKAKSKLREEEKVVVDEYYKFIKELSGIKVNESLF